MPADHNLRPVSAGGAPAFSLGTLLIGRPELAQIAAAVSAHQPSRDDLLSLASIQARTAADAIDGGDVAAGRALLLDALGFIERARTAG
jgi:hypothetical protein